MSKTGKGGGGGYVTLEVTVSSAKDVKNAKMFGKMSPCASVTVEGTSMTQVTQTSSLPGVNPVWNQTFTFQVPECVLASQDPKPVVKFEVFASADLAKSLGMARVLLIKAIVNYDEPNHSSAALTHKGKVKGAISFSIKCDKASFAPTKDTPEYDSWSQAMLPPPAAAVPQAQAYHATPHGSYPPQYQALAGSARVPSGSAPALSSTARVQSYPPPSKQGHAAPGPATGYPAPPPAAMSGYPPQAPHSYPPQAPHSYPPRVHSRTLPRLHTPIPPRLHPPTLPSTKRRLPVSMGPIPLNNTPRSMQDTLQLTASPRPKLWWLSRIGVTRWAWGVWGAWEWAWLLALLEDCFLVLHLEGSEGAEEAGAEEVGAEVDVEAKLAPALHSPRRRRVRRSVVVRLASGLHSPCRR